MESNYENILQILSNFSVGRIQIALGVSIQFDDGIIKESRFEEIATEIAKLETTNDWRRVEDELPEGIDDLIGYWGFVGVVWYDTIKKKWFDKHNYVRQVTYWMPLPSRPDL